MSAFSEAALERKLSELSNSQQSVQTLSLWLIHHRKHSALIVSVWERELRKDGDRKVRKRTYEQIKVDENNCSPRSSPTDPPQTTDLIRALQELENAASGDAAVHQRIASLPIEVQDVSLLDRITDKESGEQLSKMVDDACMLLADYNGRLAAEIDDRKQLTRMLSDFLRCQKEFLAEKEHKLEEYKRKLARVSQVRKELRSRIQNLPDLSRLPNVTGSHVHLPFAGDIYSDD
ncbi:regulation of nuclear pre-mRNA domain-containing protein 1A isoform X4 [Pyrgilauda ruficollis]|uniref:regulation of nuclear pre-mRNA domain-containing protein 1A isoform X4 n=1 Tax=Onychostruthus taczanowskii TaxID=356909 RepID=UPI0008DB84EF|nr:regulation of nuclear pre-mRNA domain-containing protein 1A isoform X4 [Onychostruthus taczanowskii]XP_041331807.1 regulation of nuclear pre-mRNA domain-containing protein 1A isoform X4 [Pyrgilauda ruficollis]XP_054505369.1 regulation of nuclear pre-mRNA domain-containing protein 1A isoform X5 [Agelaius phoeniceus]